MLSTNTIIGCAACCFGSVLLVLIMLLVAVLLDAAAKAHTALRLGLADRESDVHDALAWLQAQGCQWSAATQLRLAERIAVPEHRSRIRRARAALRRRGTPGSARCGGLAARRTALCS